MESQLMKKAETFEEFQKTQPISDRMGQISKVATITLMRNDEEKGKNESFAQIVKSLQKTTSLLEKTLDIAENRGFVQPDISKA